MGLVSAGSRTPDLTVEVNGDWQESLHIFSDPFEEYVPSPDDPSAIYLGQGIHEVTNLTIGNGKTVYIAGGAYVRGSMTAGGSPSKLG